MNVYRHFAVRSAGCVLTALGAIAVTGVASPTSAQPISKPSEIPAEAFAQLPLISSAALSPDGNYVSFLRPVDGRRHLIIQKVGGGERPTVLPTLKNLEYDWARWANNERLVVALSYSAKRGITETLETRLIAVDRDGTDIKFIIKPGKRGKTGSRLATTTLPPPQLQHNVIDWLPSEPDHILVSVDEDSDGRQEVRKVNILDADYDIVRSGTRGIQGWVVDQNHTVRLGYGYDSSKFMMKLRSADGSWYEANRKDWWDLGHVPQKFTDDPDVVYVIGPNGQGRDALHTLSLSSGELLETVFSHDQFDIEGLIENPTTGKPVGVSYIADLPRSHYFDKSFASLQASIDKAFPDTSNRLVSMSDDRQRLLVQVSSDVVPGAYYYWDRANRSVSIIANTMPDLPSELLAPVRSVWLEARDGLPFEAFLTVPVGSSGDALPTIVLPHGGPQARDDRSFWFLSQFLASRGYAVLQPNFRGSTGYGDAFLFAGRKEWGGKMQQDVTDATLWMIDEGIADPERICIVGWSYGGYAAAMGAIQEPDLYRCAASINGVLNLPRLIADDKKYIGGRAWTRHMGLSEAKASDVSPYHLAEELQDPLLIIQATDDARVHTDQGKGMARRLKRLKKDHEYVEVDFGGHSMSNEPARLTILRSVEAFLAKHNGAP